MVDNSQQKRLRRERELAGRIIRELNYYLSRNNFVAVPQDAIEVVVRVIRKEPRP
jgi:hypothetical protein